jgi:lambda family phage portal protein
MIARTPHPSSSGPRLDIERHKGIYTALGYRSVSVAAKEGRSYPTGSGDYFLEYDRPELLRQSRHFYRNNAIYRGLIDRAVSYIVGRGFSLRVLNTSNNEAVESAWRDWYRTAEVRGLHKGKRLAAAICRETLLCGDVGAKKLNGGQVQLVESEQITKGHSAGIGIDLDEVGRPTRFHVCPYGRGGQVVPSQSKPVAPENFLFVSAPDRPSQTRGVPVLQPAFPMLHRINDVCDSEAAAWQLLSRLAIGVTREAGDERAYAESIADPNKTNAAAEGDVAARLIELDYAVIFNARPGEKAEGIARNIPGENFTESLRTFLRLLGLPLGMPLELILLDWSQANYSQSRAVLEQAYQKFSDWQDILEEDHYKPLWDWQRSSLLEAAGVTEPKGGVIVEWTRPVFPWIDQLKEAQARGVKMDRGFSLHADVLKELGRDREQVILGRVAEIRDAIGRSQKIKAEMEVDVPWQLFCGLQAPKAETPAGLRDSSLRAEKQKDENEESDDADE